MTIVWSWGATFPALCLHGALHTSQEHFCFGLFILWDSGRVEWEGEEPAELEPQLAQIPVEFGKGIVPWRSSGGARGQSHPVGRVRVREKHQRSRFGVPALSSAPCPSALLQSHLGDVGSIPFPPRGLGRSGIIPEIFLQCLDSVQTLQRVLLGKWGEAGRPGRAALAAAPEQGRNLLSSH